MGPLARKLDERFTYGDYLTWDDGKRWELIDGVPNNKRPRTVLPAGGVFGCGFS